MYHTHVLCVYVLVWVLCTQVCYLKGSQASNLKGNGVSQSLGAKTQAACWQILLIQRRWNEKERERKRGGGEKERGRRSKWRNGEGWANGWERKRERAHTHTPFCALSGQTHPHMVGVSVLWSSSRWETQRHAGLRPVLGGDITCVNWARRHSYCWC